MLDFQDGGSLQTGFVQRADRPGRVPARSLKEQFSRSSEAWKEQSDPIFRFRAEGE
jgi:hypothetical protein